MPSDKIRLVAPESRLETGRLSLEPISPDHASVLYECMQDERLHRFIPQDPPTRVGAVAAEIDTRNAASIALVEALGFERVGFQKDADHFKGDSSDEYRYEIKDGLWAKKLPGS